MKNKRKMMLMAMFASLFLLVVSGFANAQSVSGYTAFKDGVRNTLNLRNATVEFSANAMVDGVAENSVVWFPFPMESRLIKADIDNGMKYEKNGNSERYCVKVGNQVRMSHSPNIYRQIPVNQMNEFFSNMFEARPQEVRMVEILADALSGASKDCFFVTDENGVKTITVRLDREQIPEILNAGMEIVYLDDNYSRYDYAPNSRRTAAGEFEEKVYCGFLNKVEVTGFSMTAVMSSENCLADLRAEMIIRFTDYNDDVNQLVYQIEFTVTDIGTTTVELPGYILAAAN